MTVRVDYHAFAEGISAMYALEKAVRRSGLERSMVELVKVRASQINGCAFCIDMHRKRARGRGESEERLRMLDAWRDSALFDERERAALALCEAITRIAEDGVSGRGLGTCRAALRAGGARAARLRDPDHQRAEPARDLDRAEPRAARGRASGRGVTRAAKESAVQFMPAFIFPQILLAGLMVPRAHMPALVVGAITLRRRTP